MLNLSLLAIYVNHNFQPSVREWDVGRILMEKSDWPSHAAAYEWLGMLYEQEGKRAQAAEECHAALGVDPGRKQVRVRLEHLEKLSSR